MTGVMQPQAPRPRLTRRSVRCLLGNHDEHYAAIRGEHSRWFVKIGYCKLCLKPIGDAYARKFSDE